jgi:RecB family endonuclease NucS
VNQPELDETLREAVKQSPGNDIRTLESLIREDVTRLEEGLTIIDDDLPVSDTSYPKPDILARDKDGNVVLIEIVAQKDVPRRIPDLKHMADQLTELAEEYGDSDQVRPILAVPYADSISEKAQESLSIELTSIFDQPSEFENLIN